MYLHLHAPTNIHLCRCSVPVKFWLLENFLSPEFKDSIQQLADSVGFEVAFVTYRWPMWLRKQTVKQKRPSGGTPSQQTPGDPQASLASEFCDALALKRRTCRPKSRRSENGLPLS